ncbi:SLAM family member 5-like isoform X2 [Onychostoma macrolepis]|uniref:SLAM family member 5-like isoform X2 n=1 Tax=Onychostoma macrolepis TaxID=369639 RepID=UPI00272D9861|nr:SLAM family member 5-like isoform X2 [Onychostoma macrolepis]
MIHKSFFLCLWIWISHGVFDVKTDEIKLSVMEGDSVTLNTDVTEVQKNDHILWMFQINNSDTRVAEIHKQVVDMYDSNETFGDRLQMDSQTGSLTIRNIRTEHSGLYKLTIIKAGVTYKRFSVAVYAPLPIPVITGDTSNCTSSSSSERSSVSRCVLLCSVVNVEYQDKNTYSCVINNPISNQTQHNINIAQLCHTCPELKQQTLLVVLSVVMIILVLAVVVGAIYFNRRKCKQARSQVQTCKEEVLYAETTFCARSVHSTVRHCILQCAANLSAEATEAERKICACTRHEAENVPSCADVSVLLVFAVCALCGL